MGLSDCLRHRQKKKREEVKLLQSITLERQAVRAQNSEVLVVTKCSLQMAVLKRAHSDSYLT